MARITHTLKYDWQFSRGEIPNAEKATCRHRHWETVRVPHDYAITGPFDPQHDKGNLLATADGFPAALGAAGRTGALPLAGTAWYRREIVIQQDWQGKEIFLEFDGVMSHCEIFLNGQLLHKNVYGYTSFCVDVTPAVRWGEKNLLAIRVSQYPWESRWYSGAGIYRNVRLTVKAPTHIPFCGICVTTPVVTEETAEICLRTEIANPCPETCLSVTLTAPDGTPAAAEQVPGNCETAAVTLRVNRPKRWSHRTPVLYTATVELRRNGEILDAKQLRIGLREICADKDKGFFVNGEYTKLNGVCMHHDLGAIGAAVNESALRRQFRILQDMGCNAIRTSHNPPAPEVLDLADEFGFYVIDEAFDQWKVPKTTNGYSLYFDACAEADLTAMIRRDRNHPSVIMWSIGNEVGDQDFPEGGQTAKFLADICRREDPTRPVTCGFDREEGAWKNGLIGAVDVVGYNYRSYQYDFGLQTYGLPLYGSETASCVSSRGAYYIPEKEPQAKRLIGQKPPARQWERRVWKDLDYVEIPPPVREAVDVNSYDLAAPPWATYPEVEFAAQDDFPQLLGEFVWTGFDYLGEPTPYGLYSTGSKLARSSYFGIVDLAGIPKDRFWSYQSRWTDKPVLHLFPHWNWQAGDVLPVCCYTSFQRAELFVNGKSYGICEKEPGGANTVKRHRLMWENVAFEPGTLEVQALDAEGNVQMTTAIQTAGEPARVELCTDREYYCPDGDDLCYVTAKIVDKNGNLCPRADTLLTFSVEGCGEFIASDNGCQTDLVPFPSSERNAYNGYAVGIFRTLEGKSGCMQIRVCGEDLPDAEICVPVK